MFNHHRLSTVFGLLIVLGMVLSACAPAATPPPATQPATSIPVTDDSEVIEGEELVVGVAAGSIDHLDPNLAYFSTSWRITWMACTPLLTFADETGNAGKIAVPGLADLPVISADAKTYTFTLREGVKFADGTPITGEDVKATFERIFSPVLASPAAGFFTAIVGSAEYASGSATEISGITVNGNEVTFNLNQSIASFTNRLTMPLTCIVPKDSPMEAQENGELLVTGPYIVESYEPNRLLTLVRNPYYSGPPRGHFKKISVQIGIDPATAGLMIRANQLDLYLDPLAGADASQIIQDQTLADRVFVSQDSQTVFLWMNNDVPPFDNVKVRQAVNYAINRETVVRIMGGPSQAQPTSQILPTAMEGWVEVQNYPYTPDLDKARELLAESGVALPIETVIRTISDVPVYVELAQAIQAQLAEVGINVTIEMAPSSVNGSIIQTRANRVPMALDGWSIDYPDADNVIDTLLNGSRITETNNQNRACFNVPEINQMIDDMNTVTGPDRGAQWQAIDQLIMSQYAPWAPLYYPVRVDLISERIKVPGWIYHPIRGEDLAVVEPAQ